MSLLDPGDPHERASSLRAAHHERYGPGPVTIGRAPGRVTLVGEHTDHQRGLVLPVALPHATWAAVTPRADHRLRLASRQAITPWEGHLDDVATGAVPGWAGYVAGVVWALREQGLDVPGLDVLVDGTVPLGAGLSSSASLEGAVAVAVARLLGLDLAPATRRRLVAACVRAETEVVGAPTGGMDQTVALLAEPGSALLVDFDRSPDDPAATRAVPLDLDGAGLVLLVTDTGVAHRLADGGGYGDRRAECDAAAAALGLALRAAEPADLARISDPVLRRRARHVVTENARVEDAVAAVEAHDWHRVGRLLTGSHTSLRDDLEVSCAELDVVVETAQDAGVLGARMTGGGFGGSTVALVPRARLDEVTDAVDRAFAGRFGRAPQHLLATPSGPAGIL